MTESSKYQPVAVPFARPFEDLSSTELVHYGAWFHDVAPARVQELTRAVTTTPGFESWLPDNTPASLGMLSRWFAGQAELRQLTPTEVGRLTAAAHIPGTVPQTDLTERTYSLAFDIGMYFSQVALSSIPGVRWTQQCDERRDADFGQPVLIGFGRSSLNPVRIARVHARRLLDGKPSDLQDVLGVWAKLRR
ncbi:MAG: hypothetical protein IT459_15680 [Planctomycetes bacterium]|nr:hypothetical protein [Planctomycetota bacterium]